MTRSPDEPIRRGVVQIKELLQSLGEKVAGNASVRTVFGEPISAEGKTIVPVASIGYGFGAGASSKHKDDRPSDEGGGGGGAGARPVGVVEITAQQTRFIRFSNYGRLAGVFGAGVVFGMALARRRKR
jgi:uncharacterized spore protein YtfJ